MRECGKVLYDLCAKYWRTRSGYIYYFSPKQVTDESARDRMSRLVALDLDSATAVGSWNGIAATTIAHRLGAGDRCLALSQNDKPVAALWLHQGNCYVRGADLWIQASASTYYCYGVISKPSERGKGLYKELLAQLAVLAEREAMETIVQYVETWNPIPKAVLPLCGYQPLFVSSRRRGFFRNVAVYNSKLNEITYHWQRKEPAGTFLI